MLNNTNDLQFLGERRSHWEENEFKSKYSSNKGVEEEPEKRISKEKN